MEQRLDELIPRSAGDGSSPTPVARADWPPCLSGLGRSLHGRVGGNWGQLFAVLGGVDLERPRTWLPVHGSNRRSGMGCHGLCGVKMHAGHAGLSMAVLAGRRPTEDQASASGLAYGVQTSALDLRR